MTKEQESGKFSQAFPPVLPLCGSSAYIGRGGDCALNDLHLVVPLQPSTSITGLSLFPCPLRL